MLCVPEQENNQVSLYIYTSLGTDRAFDWAHSCVTDTRAWQELVCRTLAGILDILLNTSHNLPKKKTKKQKQNKETNKKAHKKKRILGNGLRTHCRINYVLNLLFCNHLFSLLPSSPYHLKRVKKLGEESNTQDVFRDWQEFRTSFLTKVN